MLSWPALVASADFIGAEGSSADADTEAATGEWRSTGKSPSRMSSPLRKNFPVHF
jgi:hypothetical protein